MRTTTEHTMTPPACLRRFSIQRRTGLAREMTRGPTHENPGYELTWVESGRMEFEVGHSVLTATTGACILLPPGLENTPRSRTVTLHQLMLHPTVIAEASDALGGRSKKITESALIGADERVAALARIAAKEAETGLDENDPGLSSLMDAIAIAIVRPAPALTREPIDARIRRALDRVAAEYDQSIGVDELAAAAELPRFAFLRAFRAQVGESPYRYLMLHRLDRAAELLRRSQASVLDVALACGFNDPGRFARLFRDRFGCTPLAYRRQRHDSLRG